MDILTVITPSHERLYREFFLKNLPAGATVREKHLRTTGDGGYLSRDWQDGVTAKLKWVLEYMAAHDEGGLLVLSDIDILLYPALSLDSLANELLTTGLDIAFQRESADPMNHEANTGFYVARNTPYVKSLLTAALELCERSETRNDQTAINQILDPADFNHRWGLLPTGYYARSQCFPPPRTLFLHHANCTRSVEQKITQLRRVERLHRSTPGRAILIIREILDYALDGRLLGLIRRRLPGSR